jgi:hypothetical protein
MEIIQKPRNDGKTTELIKKSAENFSYIVCHDHQEAHRISEQARLMELNIPFPITFNEFLQGQFSGRGINSFLIDNADWLLNSLAKGVEIKCITLTKEA